jgi:TonB family protein
VIRYPVDYGTLLASDAYRRWLGWSAVAHLLLAFFLAFGPGIYRSAPAQAPVFVEIVAPASRPAKRARQVVKEPVVIPKKQPKVAKDKPAPEPAPDMAQPEQPLTPDQILAQLREKHGETNVIERTEGSASGGPNARVDPEMAAYRRRLENLIYANWAGARSFQDQLGVEVLFEVEVDSGGVMRSLRMVKSSGNRHLDESAERAIQKSSPFPRPPRSVRSITVRMNPRDSA